MTNEELKEKIAGILKEAMKPIEYGGDIEHAPEVHYPTEDEIAYALIEAGIGDVLGHRVFVSKDGKEIKQLYNGKEVEQIVKERNMYKRRAEVAQRALKELKKREQSVCIGTEWKAVVTDEDIDKAFGICNPDGEAENPD